MIFNRRFERKFIILDISGLFIDKLFQHLGKSNKGNRRKDSLSTLGIKY